MEFQEEKKGFPVGILLILISLMPIHMTPVNKRKSKKEKKSLESCQNCFVPYHLLGIAPDVLWKEYRKQRWRRIRGGRKRFVGNYSGGGLSPDHLINK